MSPIPNRKLEALPLLETFQALLDHGGVSPAAKALQVTQSAVSKHLAKLRAIYGDELFVRTPGGLRPTPRALEMGGHVASILADAAALLDARPFSPAALAGVLTISTTDEISSELAERLIGRIEREAPGVRLTFLALERDYSQSKLESGAVDLVISVNWHAPDGLKQSRVRDDRFVCLMSARHRLAAGGFSTDAYAAATHVMVAPLGMRLGYIDEVLAQKGLSRIVRLSVPSFFQITPAILGEDKIVTLPRRVAEALVRGAGAREALVMTEPPFEIPSLAYYAIWHARFDRDPRHLWLRALVREALRDERR